jgi:hypothetical protein
MRRVIISRISAFCARTGGTSRRLCPGCVGERLRWEVSWQFAGPAAMGGLSARHLQACLRNGFKPYLLGQPALPHQRPARERRPGPLAPPPTMAAPCTGRAMIYLSRALDACR